MEPDARHTSEACTAATSKPCPTACAHSSKVIDHHPVATIHRCGDGSHRPWRVRRAGRARSIVSTKSTGPNDAERTGCPTSRTHIEGGEDERWARTADRAWFQPP